MSFGYVVSLSDPRACKRVGVVGGKAAALAELADALPSISIPPGLVVTTHAWSSLCRHEAGLARSVRSFERLLKKSSSMNHPDFRPLADAAASVRQGIEGISI